MDMTQIVLAIVGSVSVWALKSVIELQRNLTRVDSELKSVRTEHDGEIRAVREAHDANTRHLLYRVDELKGLIEKLASKLDREIEHEK